MADKLTAVDPSGRFTFQQSFTGKDLEAIDAARRRAAERITNISRETEDAIRDAIVRALDEGIPPRETAELIRLVIGLSRRGALAVAARRRDLVARGLSESEVRAATVRYADKLLDQRAMLIARTEIMRMQNEGQLAGWRAAVSGGLLGPDMKKQWLVSADDRLCRYCRPMGKHPPIALDAQFKTPLGRKASPPLHPSCRCTLGLARIKTERRRRVTPGVATGVTALVLTALALAAKSAADPRTRAAATRWLVDPDLVRRHALRLMQDPALAKFLEAARSSRFKPLP